MMRSRMQTTAMFQYFCLDDWVPADHLLRAIDRHVDFHALRAQLRPLYSDVGRPSVDPEVLLRILLIGYPYGITSERRLIDEVGLNLAYRWFTGLGFDQSIPDHSTFSKNRQGRFRESTVFRDFFEQIVRRCIDVGLVEGQRFSVDGTIVAANASSQSRVPRTELPEAAKISRTAQEYFVELETKNESDPESPPGKPPSLTDTDGKVSTSDPDAAWASKGGPIHLSYLTTTSLTTPAISSLTSKRPQRGRVKKSSQRVGCLSELNRRLASHRRLWPPTKATVPDRSWRGLSIDTLHHICQCSIGPIRPTGDILVTTSFLNLMPMRIAAPTANCSSFVGSDTLRESRCIARLRRTAKLAR